MFILIPSVYAIYGGDTWVYHFDKCRELEVNITADEQIDNGEYQILNNCTKIDNNSYDCKCNDNFDFNVSFHSSARNNYTFTFNYVYDDIKIIKSGGSSGGSGGGIKFVCSLPININSTYCQGFCQRYINLNNCSKLFQAEHLCCITYFEKDIDVRIEDDSEIIPIELDLSNVTSIEINETVKIEESEPVKKNLWIWIVGALLIISLIILYVYIRKRKNEY